MRVREMVEDTRTQGREHKPIRKPSFRTKSNGG